jgi:tetratricopeptide (TPR) repeat protein
LDRALLPASNAVYALRPLIERAMKLYEQGATKEAESLALQILELAPGQPDILSLHYRICRAGGQHAAAEALLRRLVRLHPNNFWATNELTLALLSKGAIAEAEVHARNAIRIAPARPQSHNLMGMVLTEANRPHFGEYHYRKVIDLTGQRTPVLLANLAWNLKQQGRLAEARKLYEEATADGPDVLQTLLGWARLEEADRNFERAQTLLDRAEALAPGDPSVSLARAVVYGRQHNFTRALTLLDAAGKSLGPNEMLEKGRLLDRMGHYKEAFAAIAEGKRQYREHGKVSYRADQARQLAEQLKTFFTAERISILPRAGRRENIAQPIFIVGFPRSGTTLVEQTLSAHSRISAGDELPYITDIAAGMTRTLNSPLSYPEALAELWMGDRLEGLETLRDQYLARVRQLGIIEPTAAWFTDKMPLNEMHLGLIALLFPQSPLIHVIRHPLDVVLSTFANNLTHGFNCAFALETVAQHYVLVSELVAHYRSQMTLRYLPVRYEDIIDRQEDSVRRIFDFIGETLEQGCLYFHENRRHARTASYAQVSEPLYQRSRYRYRHYLKELEPVIPQLESTIRDLGYSIE